MAEDTGVWVKVWPDFTGGAPGAAVIGDATADDPLFPVNTSSFTGDGTNGDLGQAYDVYEFLGSGELVVSEPGFVDALVVGGGAAGGQLCGGGGGAGGVFGLGMTEVYLDKTQTITVGAGGVKRGNDAAPGSGQSSAVGNFVAVGGGAGGTYAIAPQPGGSGGGGNGADYAGDEPGGEPALTQGNRGGDGVAGGTSAGGGGGGGAGAAGTNASGTTAGNGGDGIDISSAIGSVTERWIAGGGGAGSGGTAGKGGKGGGGDGIAPAGAGSPGEINTGGGGGGGGQSVTSGGNGGSGIVFVRVKVNTRSFDANTRSTAPRTAHAARIEDGIVRQVIVIPHLDDDDAKITEYCNRIGLPGTWVDTSYLGSRRGKYAGVGDTFTMTKSGGEFISPIIEEEPVTLDLPGEEA